MGTLRTLVLVAALAVLLAGAPATMSPQAASAASEPAPVTMTSGTRPGPDPAEAEARLATEVLGKHQAEYRLLEGVTVSIGETPRGEQAVAYYTEGRILVSFAHATSLESILAHEVWHIIDWRDNGKLDWGEQLPPVEAYSYLKH